MTGHTIAYRRVSTVDQNTVRQLDGRTFDREFEDKASGKDTKRPQLEAMLGHIRAGDTVVVHSIDRLARSMSDLLALVEHITGPAEEGGKGASLEFAKEGLRFSGGKANATDRLMLNMLGAVAEFERSMIRERQAEGIAAAKERGVYKGSKPKLSDAQVLDLLTRVQAGEPKAGIARDFGISRETLYQYVRAAEAAA
ncbi:MAG: transposase [Variovorax paradoxus]|uniref:Transposase n=1 Tax=Variovorax paradoxus TaxID=34073 RepID=A0A2W5SBF0_VARPD|nr:MAG: transposase [Variovorax paradoxus]